MGRATAAEHAPAARVVLVALAVAVAVALLVAQHLKDKPPLIDGTGVVWHPTGGRIDARAQPISFSFKVGYSDRITVTVVAQRTGKIAAVVARELRVRPNPRVYFSWPGAASAPPGTI